MAVDTRYKRFAMMNLNLPFLGFNQPLADGIISSRDRQRFLWGYPGIVWAGAAVVVKAIVSPIIMTGRILLPPLARVRGASKGIIR